MDDHKAPHVQAAFINAIREEGTKAEACDWLQRIWNEKCALEARLAEAEARGREAGLREAAQIASLAPYERGGIVCGCSEGLSNWTETAILARIDQPKGEA